MIISGQVKSMREGNAMRIIAKVAGEVVRGATVLACTNIAILTGFVLLFGGKKEEEEPPTREATVPTEPVLPAAA